MRRGALERDMVMPPAGSIKWGDTLRPYDGQRINESQRKRSREYRSTDTGGGISISVSKMFCTPFCDLVDKNRRWGGKTVPTFYPKLR